MAEARSLLGGGVRCARGLEPGNADVCVCIDGASEQDSGFIFLLIISFTRLFIHFTHMELLVCHTVCQAWALRQIPIWPLPIESVPSESFSAVLLKLGIIDSLGQITFVVGLSYVP